MVDLSYAGLFAAIRNMPEASISSRFLLGEAPRLLFPFARRVLADAVRDGGFPPLMLEPIDFNGIYLLPARGEPSRCLTGGPWKYRPKPDPRLQGAIDEPRPFGLGSIGGLTLASRVLASGARFAARALCRGELRVGCVHRSPSASPIMFRALFAEGCCSARPSSRCSVAR